MAAFPSLFTPESQMPQTLQQHLRYPEDIFTVQTAMFGKYHIDGAAAFYNAGDAWSLSESAGAGSPTAALQNTVTTNAQGQSVVGQVVRMAPIYQVLQIPGQPAPSFNIMEAYVPVSQNDSVQTLAGFVFGNCNYGSDYGKLTVFQTPAGVSIDGPALVDARILANTTVSKEITLLNSGGSSVVLGNLLVVPVDGAILYFRPLYVQGRGSYPVLQEIIGVYGGQGSSQVYMEPTLSQTLDDDLRDDVVADHSYEAVSAFFRHSTGVEPGTNSHLGGLRALTQDPDRSERPQPRPVPVGRQQAEPSDRPAESADQEVEEGLVYNHDHDEPERNHDDDEPDNDEHHLDDIDEHHHRHHFGRDDE